MKSAVRRAQFRKLRVRKKVVGTSQAPRLSVYRSSKHIYAQIVDDTLGKTLAAASTRAKGFETKKGVEAAQRVGNILSKLALDRGIKKVVFDRGGMPYHGRIKALADGAREGGLQF